MAESITEVQDEISVGDLVDFLRTMPQGLKLLYDGSELREIHFEQSQFCLSIQSTTTYSMRSLMHNSYDKKVLRATGC